MEFEVLPLLYIVADYAASSSNKDRKAIANELMTEMKSTSDMVNSDLFFKRADFYGQIIRGKEIRFDWYLGDTSGLPNDPISRCTYSMLDILYNEKCGEDYDNAPICIDGIDKTVFFTQNIAIPILEIITKYFMEMYK